MSLSTVTINTINYVVYATVAEADARLAVDPTRAAAWTALTDDKKAANLVAATRRMDLLSYTGEKAGGVTQENEWPRTGATCDGEAVTSTDVPIELENATILTAGSITLSPSNANSGNSGSNIKRVAAGSANVEFFQPTLGVALQDETAHELVRCLLAATAGAAALSGQASGVTGDLSESSFTDVDFPGLDDGYP
jgi:hypothetical protein